MIPQRKYLFGEPDEKKAHALASFGISAYDKNNDLFIVLRLTKEGKNKEVNIVWMKPQ